MRTPPKYRPKPINTSDVQLSQELEHLIERLAENNHELWAQGRIAEGWTLGKRTDEVRKKHPCLVPYNELPESEKEYDRAMAVETLKVILAVGFQILPPGNGADQEAGARDLLSDLNEQRQLLASSQTLTAAELHTIWRTHDERLWSVNSDLYALLGRRFLRLGDPVVAHEVIVEGCRIRRVPDAQMDYLLGLALANSGALHQANAIATELRDNLAPGAPLIEDVLGLLGRTHKDLALTARESTQRTWHLSRAQDAYGDAFRRTQGSYSAINAATVALLLGQDAEAASLARQARKAALRELPRSGEAGAASYWQLATLGEAALILRDFGEAERWYGEALQNASDSYGHLASTRRQARLIAAHRGEEANWIDSVLRVPRVVVFAGHMLDQPGRSTPRFPPEAETHVSAAIEKRLRDLDAGFGFSAAACGSDILFLEAMSRLQGQTFIVLPYAKEQFLQTSVVTAPEGDWVLRFHDAIGRATEIIVASGTHVPASGVLFDYGNLLMLGLATMQSRWLETEIVPLAFWDEQETRDVTASVVRQWREAGHKVEVISPAAVLRDSGWAPSHG